MASQIKVDQLAGAAGNTVTIPAGQTLDVLGTLDIDAGTLVLPNTVVTTTGTQTLTNKTINASQLVDSSVATGKVADDAITLAKMASGTDGNIISYDASGNPVAVATGSAGQVLTSAGAGAVPSFQTNASGDVTLNGTQTLTNKTLTAPKIGTSILDTNGNELALLTATSSAVNEFTIANGASGNAPRLSATGETNVDLDLLAKGTGHVTVRGNNNSGAVQFNCEDNSHGQIVIAQPHSAGVTNTLTLPAGSSSTLVSRVSTDTLTNKTINASQLVDGSIATGKVADDAITLAKMAPGTDGNIISFDTSGNPVAVATGSSGQVLTSAGAGAIPSFQTPTTGDITGVTAGTNLTGGGTSGDVTLNLADASTSAKGAAQFSSGNFSASSGTITIKNNGVDTAQIQTGAVTTAKIGDGSITVGKMGSDSVDSAQYVNGSIDTAHIANSQITNALMADNAIDTAEIAASAVETDKINDNAVTLAKMASGTDGNIISYDASGNPVAVATGSAGQILTSAGAGAVPTFADAAAAGTEWQAVKTSNFTAAAGQGVFCNTTSASFTLTLPPGTLGHEVSFIDYAGTFDSNPLTIASYSSEKIAGSTDNLTVSVERAANTLVYTDGTQGWLLTSK